jgi:FkbM family methyltransferase
MKKRIITATNRAIDFEIEDQDIIEHFQNPDNCTEIILRQINEERMYQHIFEGESDLTIFDIGANIGLFGVYVMDCAEKIYAVEPTPNHYDKLGRITAAFHDKIKPINCALGAKDGTMDFYVSSKNPTQNSLISNWRSADEEKISVETKDLATLFKDVEHIDFVKCDIEGGEIIALTKDTVGAVKDKVDCWYIETHQTDNTIPHGESVKQNLDTLREVFEINGYGVQQLNFDTLWCYKETEDAPN